MRNVILSDSGSKDSVLSNDDNRLRRIPFMVGKPTLEEVKSIHKKCSRVLFRKKDSESGKEVEVAQQRIATFSTTSEAEDVRCTSSLTSSTKILSPAATAGHNTRNIQITA